MRFVRFLLFFIALQLIASIVHAQGPDTTKIGKGKDTSWRAGGFVQLNFSQVSLTNWEAGGQSSITGTGLAHFEAIYSKGQHKWASRFDGAYGLTQQGERDAPVVKSTDQLKIYSQYTRALDKTLNYAVSGDFQTTFTPGYHYAPDSTGELKKGALLSKFMAPGYLTIATGIEYSPSKNFYAMLAPVAGRFTFVYDDSLSKQGAYGVKPGQNIRAQLGANFKNVFKIHVMKNIDFRDELTLFDAYDHPETVVVDWIMALTMNVNNFVTASVGTHLIYDQSVEVTRNNGTIGPAVQFQELIAVGLQYKF